ncbi:hypothetical protein A0H81_12540 [Grifola frondosa]|uniref:Uncharacterized protein n=1 Tax=Grifola frondosa TaxID=5627 RepID=A0A1C7LSB2_GRIFR|nr:hypothetical protein A0H81_12540 [Grifola frondosa]
MAAIAHFAQPDPGSSSAYSSSYDSSLLQWPQSLGTVTNADQPYLVGPGSSYVWDTQEPIHPSSSYSSSSHQSSSSSFPPPPSFQPHLPSPSYHPPSYTPSSDYQPPPYQPSSTYSNAHSSSHASNSYPPHYPESSQRTVLTGAAHPASSGVHPSALGGRSYFSGTRSYTSLAASSTTPRLERATWDSAELYTIEPATEPAPRQPSPHVNVKEEDTDCAGAFIFELAPSEPTCDTMPEVPLRATQAPPAMRKMMTSFRLDPFAMHNGIRSAAVAAGPGGVEIGPLREEPVIIEWQVHLDFPLVPQDDVPAQAEEDRWEAPASLEYTAFSSPGDSPEFEPLMTPAQSLNWSMRYQPTGSIGEHAAYPLRMGGGRGRAAGAQDQYVEYDMYRSAPAHAHAHAHSRHNEFQDYFPPSNSWYRESPVFSVHFRADQPAALQVRRELGRKSLPFCCFAPSATR